MTEFNNGEEACFLNDFLCQLNGGPSVFPARWKTARCSKTSISRLSEVRDNERQ